MYVIDVKGTRSRIEADGRKWHPSRRAPFRSPLPKLRCIERGVRDVGYITSVRSPRIPDDATRITLPSANIQVDPRTARESLAKYPRYWLDEVTCESGPMPLHTASGWDGDPAHMVLWSDGRLESGCIHPPADAPAGAPYHSLACFISLGKSFTGWCPTHNR